MCNLQKRVRSFKNIMFDHKHVYVSLLKHKCLKVKHVSVSCFYSAIIIVMNNSLVHMDWCVIVPGAN